MLQVVNIFLQLHKLDSLTLLLYTFLLTLTVVTIWLFKHRSNISSVIVKIKRNRISDFVFLF